MRSQRNSRGGAMALARKALWSETPQALQAEPIRHRRASRSGGPSLASQGMPCRTTRCRAGAFRVELASPTQDDKACAHSKARSDRPSPDHGQL